MEFTLKISCDNAAFEPREVEIARILRDAATKIEKGQTHFCLADFNGNTVGRAVLDIN